MKKVNAFIIIGTVGLAITALLHMLMALLGAGGAMTSSKNLALWLSVYSIWLPFIVIGIALARRAATFPKKGM